MPLFAQLMGSAFRPESARRELSSLLTGATLQLEREPNNPYDANAIRVMSEGHHLGFLEKIVAAELAPQIDSGSSFVAVLVRRDDPKKPLLRIDHAD